MVERVDSDDNRDAMRRGTPDLDSLTREEAEAMAAAVIREVAKGSFSRHRNVVTATREASQLTHLALKLEGFANA